MAQQTRWHEKRQGVHNPATQVKAAVEHVGNSLRRHALRCLLTALCCLTLSLTALAQGPATEVSIQTIRSDVPVKCNENKDEYSLVVVLATMPAQPTPEAGAGARALGVALMPRGPGEVKMFARYWFYSAGQLLLRRDDDNGELKAKLIDFDKSLLKENVTSFFKGCTTTTEIPAIYQVLDQADPRAQFLIEEIADDFRANGLKLKSDEGINVQQNLNKPLTSDDAGQVLFARVMRTSLPEQLKNRTPTAGASPSPSVVTDPNTGSRGTTAKELEDTRKSLDSLSTLQRILLGVLVTALVLILVLFALFYFKPTPFRKFFFRPEDAAEIRRQAIDELYMGWRKIGEPTEAQQEVEEILNSFKQRFSDAEQSPAKLKSAYHDLESAIKRFSLSLTIDKKRGANRNNDEELRAVRQFLSNHFGDKFWNMDLVEGLDDLTEELNRNLLPLAGNDSNNSSRTLKRLMTARARVETMWSKYSNAQCPEGALNILGQEWETFQDTLQPLRQIDFQSACAYAQESIALFCYLHQKFDHQSRTPEDFKKRVKKFFRDLDTIQEEHLPDETRSNPTPEDLLTDLDAELSKNKRAVEELRNLNLAISELQRELPPSDDAITDPVGRAIKLARSCMTALELLKDYHPSPDSDNIAESVLAIKDEIRRATEAVLEVLPEASGKVNEMVSGLVNEFKSKIKLAGRAEELRAEAERLESALSASQEQAEASTKLAGALSQYVNLSADEQMAPLQVQRVLQQFSAGERAHRQLRLRLSAALPALEQAIEAVRQAGREDALEALRINDFKNQLRGLLTNMEDFHGDAMWNECLSAGFAQQWLHNLLRAELLARTYFEEADSLSLLRDALTETTRALLATMRHFNARVPVISLLGKPPAGARTGYEVDATLSTLPEAKRKVQLMLAQTSSGDELDFIVDVKLFPFRSENTDDFDGHVVVVSPSEWN